MDRKSEEKRVETAVFKETYPLYETYAHAAITQEPLTQKIRYNVIETTLTDKDKEVLREIKTILIEELDVSLKELGSREKAEQYLKEKTLKKIKDYLIKIPKESIDKLLYYIVRDFIGYGKIDPLMRDHLIEDISCDRPGTPIYVWHRGYESLPTNIIFETTEELDSFVVRLAYMAGKHISIAQPMIDAGLPDGSRIQLTLGTEVTRMGSTFTIRKFRADPLTISDLISFNTLSPEMAAYLWYLIENKASILVSGGIASGKTTMLNCLSMFIKPEMKIVSVEETPELNIPHENWISSVTRAGFGVKEASAISMFDLLKAALRQRPDYIIVGEVRGEEAYSLFQALATGHLGMATIHAASVDDIFHRLESKPMNIPRTLLTTIDVIMMQTRTEIDGKPVRRTQTVNEVIGLDSRTNELLTNEVYEWNIKEDSFLYSGRSYALEKIMKRLGVDKEKVDRELHRRKTVLEWIMKNRIRRYTDVAAVIREYYADPLRTYKKARLGMA